MPRAKELAVGGMTRIAAPIISAMSRKSRERAGLSPPIRRGEFIASVPQGDVLEIGPFYCPQMQGPRVSYFDVLDQTQSRERAVLLELDPAGCPVIDYVSPNGDLRTVGKRFDAVFSSHCVEHQPDLIRHLRDVASLLRPGGTYHLIIPDHRYCFDHFRKPSTLDEICAAEGRQLPTEMTVSNHFNDLAHNDSERHWLGLHGRRISDREGGIEALARIRCGEYVDVHNWAFTPESFRRIVAAIEDKTGLIVEAVHDTLVFSNEFMAVLRR